MVVAGASAALALGGGGLAYATGAVGGEGPETPATGADADRAGKVATDSVGGGTVAKVVQENEGAVAYDVQITKADGSTVEVEVTKDFTVAPAEAGGKESGETGPDAETGAESPDGTSGK